jgi:hypothetical protein
VWKRLNEKELSKRSFWKSAEEDESKGFSFCGFLQESERVEQESELNAWALSVQKEVIRTRILVGCSEGRRNIGDKWGWCEPNICHYTRGSNRLSIPIFIYCVAILMDWRGFECDRQKLKDLKELGEK